MKKSKLFVCALSILSVVSLASCGGESVTTFEVCDDPSNAIRAFQLLVNKGYVKEADSSTFYNGEDLAFSGSTWESSDKKVKITLIAENLLVSSMGDYTYACLPCNTAYTGNVSSSLRIAKEDDPSQVSAKANVIAVNKAKYNSDADYKKKMDVLTDVMLGSDVANYFATKYNGAMTCDSSSQIDLRGATSTAANGNNEVIKVCASDVPHAEVLENSAKALLSAKGYTLSVTVLDWTMQNDAVANEEYDANYFQHVPYMTTYNNSAAADKQLFATCKVHYEPLGIYKGK